MNIFSPSSLTSFSRSILERVTSLVEFLNFSFSHDRVYNFSQR